jgi:hypothetical protein
MRPGIYADIGHGVLHLEDLAHLMGKATRVRAFHWHQLEPQGIIEAIHVDGVNALGVKTVEAKVLNGMKVVLPTATHSVFLMFVPHVSP